QPGRRRGGRSLDGALAGQAPPGPVLRFRQALVLDAVRRGGAPGRSRLAAVRQHHVRRRDLRSPERDLRRGVRRILRRGDPAAPDRLPADLSAFGWLMAGLRLATTSGKPKRRRWPRPSLP